MRWVLFLIFLFSAGVSYSDLAPLEVTEEDASPSTFPYQVKFSNGTVTDNADGTTSVAVVGSASPTFTGDVTISDTSPSLVFTDTTASEDDFELIVDGSVARYVNTTDGITTWIHYANNGVGMGEVGMAPGFIHLITDGTGDGEIRLPTDSVGVDELDTADEPSDAEFLSFQASTRRFIWAAGGGNSFETIAVPDSNNPVADSSTDTLTLTESAGIDITGTVGTDTINFAVDLTELNDPFLGDGTVATQLNFNSSGGDTTLSSSSSRFLISSVSTGGVQINSVLNLRRSVPTLLFEDTDTGSDDFEFWNDNDVFGFSNTTSGSQIWRTTAGDGFQTIGKLTTEGGAELNGTVKVMNDLDLVMADDNITVAGANPKKSIFIPATAMWPSTLNGSSIVTKRALTTNNVDIQTIDFDTTTQEFAQFSIIMSDNWDAGTLTYKVDWTASETSTGPVVWELQARAHNDDSALDQAWGTAIEVADDFLAADDLHETKESAALTVGGSPVEGDYVHFRIARDPANAQDTKLGDADLIGIRIEYSVSRFSHGDP